MATTAEQIAQIQAQNNAMYQQNAREQRSWEEQMSNTAHRREMKDLIAAGLNPVLTATGGQGATTPSGATADVDTQSMVSYLINEMNNENSRQIANAQVAAQRYAANMAYQSSLVQASAMRDVAAIQASTSPLGFFTQALSNPDSPAGKVTNALFNKLGIDLNSVLNGQPVTASMQNQISAWQSIKNWFSNGWSMLSYDNVKSLIEFTGANHMNYLTGKLNYILKTYNFNNPHNK